MKVITNIYLLWDKMCLPDILRNITLSGNTFVLGSAKTHAFFPEPRQKLLCSNLNMLCNFFHICNLELSYKINSVYMLQTKQRYIYIYSLLEFHSFT